ncbi:UDP-N-acetylmuramate dehydrogenase [Parasphingorhabdus marina DSM 22363]|uniref:UDP-N-acetylenolpyruvoylglucosamine reductase n=1 Tax=Parasphingorhabdus marina DSM 22363 TaxID=1123272 RepID=A0A1N6GUE7_9SPHN|nr:UDP-N-acetylmuramate dehydrogenase [Parasphingorhabdus marina]SIO10965.1 UDP-N-acetylmuramate dehydrogenase [Parasphingorhabdus marina DSM 22363]
MTVATMPQVRGKLTENAALAPLVWFKSGGTAQWLFEPKDLDDLQQFLRELDSGIAVWPLGLGSNLIIRDGGIQGVVIRLGKAFAGIETVSKGTFDIDDALVCGAGAPGISAASMARDHGIAGMEFLRGIPGTIGGAVRMNAGAYGREVADILESADVVLRNGELRTLALADVGYSYRHSQLPEGAIVVSARLRGESGDPETIGAEMKRIAEEREASQPLRTKTGGSTFKNPDGKKAWQLVDEAGCRGLQMGQAQVSEKHCNFLINLGGATSSDIEALGEEVRKRVKAHSGVELHWEIQRVGDVA